MIARLPAGGVLVDALLAFTIFLAAFSPLERLFPRRRQPFLRKQYRTDLAFFSGQYLIWNGLVILALVALQVGANRLPGSFVREPFGQLPFYLQCGVALLLGDFLVYWGHRLSHQLPLLWRFHRVHHTAPRLDWLAAHREHPLDNLYTRTLENLPPILLGFPMEAIAGFLAFRGIWGLYIHSNVRDFVPGPLKYVLGSPDLHHWHHDLERGHRCNFGNLMPIMDVLFGTYYNPPNERPLRYGTEPGAGAGYVELLVKPLLPTWAARAARR